MLRSLRTIEHYTVCATDGEVGKVVNFFFDDRRWSVRYLVVDTGGFLNRHEVLISPISFSDVEWSTQQFHLTLTKDKVRNSPSVDTQKPVSRQHEEAFNNYYAYPSYWMDPDVWNAGAAPSLLAAEAWSEPLNASSEQSVDIHLRSAKEVRGYEIRATDDSIGHVDDFIVEDADWEIRYLAIDTSNWWFGKKVLVAPQWATGISWEERNVNIDMSRQAIKDSPEWEPTAIISREYEAQLYNHYRQPGYWNVAKRREKTQQPSGSDNR